MQSGIHVASPPPKPLMVFDGDCRFCGLWIRRWRQLTGDTVDYLPSQDPQIAARFPEVPREQFNTAVVLIEPDGCVISGAEAVFRALAKNPKTHWPQHLYESSAAISGITEGAYKFVASHRTAFSYVTRFLWGRHVEQPDYFLTRWVFLRALGVIYLVAFISLWTQISGLIGHNGILPEDRFMSAVRQACDEQGIGMDRFRLVPTLCWLDSSDGFLQFQCAAGTVLAIVLIFGIAPAPSLALLWLLYLSLTTVGREFLEFQWDNLLLEAGFLSIFFAPLRLLPDLSKESPPSRIVLWLLRLLLFKLMFSSGCVKLASGDPTWRNLTALTYHYFTQPLPTWIAWYANQLPLGFQKFSCVVMFSIEVGAPFLIFVPRQVRFFGAGAIAFLQILILLTGNYTFFNILTLALCLLLLDDFVFLKILPARFTQRPKNKLRPRWRLAFIIPLAAVFLVVSFLEVATIFGVQDALTKKIAKLEEKIAPLRTINDYGLFMVMTTERHEIIVQGSDDGAHWSDYEFKYKPGDLNGRPVFVAPFQPRLDWQMWFAALGSIDQNPWFQNFCFQLLQGSPEVAELLQKNPFPDKPPRYIRAELYNYHFTNFTERRATGAWWKRESIGEYLPPVSLHE
ncbi:MAG TPA: lipase maturation factor family protein [Candidatus Acidoferrales bacterium]|jgi:predicted DCC family thiol-disulfide oxidoreductase YuxK|nr:lipase maturation factor family protein [Candidatus Acidoferrales bacterium]